MTRLPQKLPVLFEVLTDDTTKGKLINAYALAAMTRKKTNQKYALMHPNRKERKRAEKHLKESFNKAQVIRRELWVSDAAMMALNVIKRLSKAETIEEVLTYIIDKEFKALGFADLDTVSKNIEDIHRNHVVALGFSHKVYDLLVKSVVFSIFFLQIEKVTNFWQKLKPLVFVGFPEVYFFITDWIKGGKDMRYKQREKFKDSSLRNKRKIERAEENEKIRARRFNEIYERGGSAFERYCEDPYLYSSYDQNRNYKIKLLRIAKAYRTIWSGLSDRYIAAKVGYFANDEGTLEKVTRRKKIREEFFDGRLGNRANENIQSVVQENIGVEGKGEFETDTAEQRP